MTTVDDTGRSCSIIHSRLTGCALSVGCCCCLTQCRGVKKTKPQNQPAAQPRGALLSIAACRYGSYYNYFLFMLKRRIRWKQEQNKGGQGTRSNGCLAVVLWLAFPNVLWDIRRRKEPEQLSNVVIETLWSNCVETGSARCMSSILCITGVVLTDDLP